MPSLNPAGRPRGARTRGAIEAQDAIAKVAERMGGAAALAEWAKKSARNRRLFYTRVWSRLVPLEMRLDATDAPVRTIEQLIVFADGERRPAPPVLQVEHDEEDS